MKVTWWDHVTGRFRVFMQNDGREDRIVNELLTEIIENDHNITKIEYSSHHVHIHMGVSYRIDIWNSNKWYAWLNQGTVYENGENVFEWNDVRVPRSILIAFDRLLNRLEFHDEFMEKFRFAMTDKGKTWNGIKHYKSD